MNTYLTDKEADIMDFVNDFDKVDHGILRHKDKDLGISERTNTLILTKQITMIYGFFF